MRLGWKPEKNYLKESESPNIDVRPSSSGEGAVIERGHSYAAIVRPKHWAGIEKVLDGTEKEFSYEDEQHHKWLVSMDRGKFSDEPMLKFQGVGSRNENYHLELTPNDIGMLASIFEPKKGEATEVAAPRMIKMQDALKKHGITSPIKSVEPLGKKSVTGVIFITTDDGKKYRTTWTYSGHLDSIEPAKAQTEAIPSIWSHIVRDIRDEGLAYIIADTADNIRKGMKPEDAFRDACENQNYHGDRPDIVKARMKVAKFIKDKYHVDVGDGVLAGKI